MAARDILIIGGGPIAAATAYHLSLAGAGRRVTLVTADTAERSDAAYRNAGGCVRWFWADPLKRAMTEETRDLIEARLAEGVELDALQNPYLFAHRGAFVPSFTITSAKLVNWMLDQAAARGAEVVRGVEVASVAKEKDGYRATTAHGSIAAATVLVALGAGCRSLVPEMPLETEKRQLFVLDLPVGPERAGLPHTIVPVGNGVAYVFIKKVAGELKVLVGQEGVVPDAAPDGPEPEQFAAVLEAGLAEVMPFLAEAKVEKVLWGHDAANKTLLVHEASPRLFAAACGSAVRGCAHIGRELAEKLLA
jgi:glycine/D-amino acid oxidase-like deaminating enzyme